MLRLYDRVLLSGVSPVPLPSSAPAATIANFSFLGWNTTPVLIVADEIAEGFWDELATADDKADPFALIAPPAEAFFIEATLPASSVEEVLLSADGTSVPLQLGCSISAMDLTREATFAPATRKFLTAYRSDLSRTGRWQDPRWLFSSKTLVYHADMSTQPFGWVTLHLTQVDASGNEMLTHTFTVADDVMASADFPADGSDELIRATLASLGSAAFYVAMRTLEMLGARNVSLRTTPSPLSRQIRRRLERESHTRYEVTYETLVVKVGNRELALTTTQPSSSGSKLERVHYVRGHIKTYTADAPLFGKYTGAWYWLPHVRGSPSEGKIVKDYRVVPRVRR